MKQVGTSLCELDQDDKTRDKMVEASYIFLCCPPPMPEVGFWKLYEIREIFQEKSGELKAYNQGSFQETQYLASFSKNSIHHL